MPDEWVFIQNIAPHLPGYTYQDWLQEDSLVKASMRILLQAIAEQQRRER